MRRAYVALVGIAILACVVLLSSDSAQGQRVKPIRPGGGPGGIPDAPPTVTSIADRGRLTLPTDDKLKAKIRAVKDYIDSEDWRTVAENVQMLLDQPTDVFVPVMVKQADGREVETLVGLRYEANRLVGTLATLPKSKPGAALVEYKSLHGGNAKTLLTQAINSNDKEKFADVAQRYLWTDAGGEAAERLATILLDRGDFMAAAQAFDRLIQRDGIEKLEPITLAKAAMAYNRLKTKEDNEKKEKIWKQLEAKAAEGIPSGNGTIALEDFGKYLERSRGNSATSIALNDWPMMYGNPSRNGQGIGDSAFMRPRWVFPLSQRPHVNDILSNKNDANSVLKKLEDHNEAIIPAFAPVTATVTGRDGKQKSVIVYRDFHGVAARKLADEGNLTWRMDSLWSLAGPWKPEDGQDPNKQTVFDAWITSYRAAHRPGVVLENSTIGALSSDGQRVYFVEDLQVPPFVPQQQANPWGGVPQQPIASNSTVQPAIAANTLQAVNIATGKLLWKLGALNIKSQGNNSDVDEYAEIDKLGLKPDHDFRDSHFLGAPLPLSGKLYFLNEKNQDIRLVCLDTNKLPNEKITAKDLDDAIAWVQPIGTAKEKLQGDFGRRINGAHIAYGEGMLVCPTNAGAIVGVDLLSHSLIWAHPYSDAPAAPPPAGVDPWGRPIGGFGPGGRPVNPGASGASIVTDWKSVPPIIVDGKVVFTAPDGADLKCLNLRNGDPIWALKRGDNDVYLAGVFAGKVIIVGKKDVRAISLEDAHEIWRRPTGMPSGRGVASNNIYYLPLASAVFAEKENSSSKKPGPGIIAIDIEKGEIVAQTRSKERTEGNAKVISVPGNLTFFDGLVISQSATEIAVYPQLKVKLGQMNELLAKNANDPDGLYERGELRLDKGELTGAVDDLHGALKNNPPEKLKGRAENKLFEAMTELLDRDFNNGEKFLDEYKSKCVVPGNPKESQRREANYWRLVAKGREKQEKFVEALNADLKFASLPAAQDELLGSVTEPAVLARPDVWARGHIIAMMEKATPAQRKPLEEEFAKKWQEAKSSGKIEELQSFVNMFGSTSTVGKDGRLFLAERLMEQPEKYAEAESEFLKVLNDDDPVYVAKAVDGLARLMTRQGELENAYHYYKTLKTRFPTKKVRDDKTGTQLFEELATDKRFLMFMDEPGAAVGIPKFEGVLDHNGNFPQTAQYQIGTYTFEALEETLPSLKRMRVAIVNSNLKLFDRHNDAQPLMNETVRGNINQFINIGMNPNMPGMPFNPNQQLVPNRFGYHSVGHLVVVNLGQYLVGIDASMPKPRKLWEINLLGDAAPNGQPMYDANTEILSVLSAGDNTISTVAMSGPVTASYVCFLTRDGLSALDPIKGTTLWTRSDVSPRSRLFGDDQYIFVVEMNGEQATPGTTRVFRAQDGAAVLNVPNFAGLYAKKERTIGRELLVADDKVPGGGVSLRLYDVIAGKDLISQKFKDGSFILHSEDPDLAGVLEPDGLATIYSLSQRKVVGKCRLNAEDLKNLKEAHLLADDQSFYVALHTTTDYSKKERPSPGTDPWENVQMNVGMRSITVNGRLYSFVRKSSMLRWHNELEHQKLSLENWREMPILLFTSRWQENMNNNMIWMARQPNQVFGNVYIEAYDKTSGRLFYKNEADRMGPEKLQVYAVNMDGRNGRIEMIAQNYKLTITQKASVTNKENGVKENKDAKPSTQGGASGAQSGSAGGDLLPRRAPLQKSDIIKE